VAAVAYNKRPKSPEVVVDETWWSDPDYCRELKVCVFFFLIHIQKLQLNNTFSI